MYLMKCYINKITDMYAIEYDGYIFYMKSKVLAFSKARYVDLTEQFENVSIGDISMHTKELENIDMVMKRNDLHNITKSDIVNENIKVILPELFL